MIGKTEIRPGQLTPISTPWRSPYWARTSIATSRATRSGQRPARQQLEVPADDGAGEDREAVDQRVEQRAQAAVLAGDPGEEAVDVVAGGDQPEDDRGAGRAAVAGFEGEVEEERDRGEPRVADEVGDRPGVSGSPFRVCARRRAAAVEAEEAPDAAAAEGRRGAVSHRAPCEELAAPARRPPRRGSLCSAPLARSVASTTPSARPRRPTTIRSGQPSSSASVSFSPGPASRSS